MEQTPRPNWRLVAVSSESRTPLAQPEPTHHFSSERLRRGPYFPFLLQATGREDEGEKVEGTGFECRLQCLDSTLSAAKNTPMRAIYSPRTCSADTGFSDTEYSCHPQMNWGGGAESSPQRPGPASGAWARSHGPGPLGPQPVGWDMGMKL